MLHKMIKWFGIKIRVRHPTLDEKPWLILISNNKKFMGLDINSSTSLRRRRLQYLDLIIFASQNLKIEIQDPNFPSLTYLPQPQTSPLMTD